jgi:LysM repeat protein
MNIRRVVLIVVVVALALALPATVAVASPQSSGYTCTAYHTVKVGETLNSISRYYGVSVQALMAANGIANPNVIYAGQTLCIPGSTPPPPPPPSQPSCGIYYTVQWGDTLSGIAARYRVSVYAIMQANNIPNPNYIYAGMILYIPCAGPKPSQPPPASCAYWKGEYFNNAELAGAPSVTRCDKAIAFNWGLGWPTPKISANNFSIRWTRTVNLSEGTYRFTMQMDDGARLFVDNVLVLDEWHTATGQVYVVDVPLGAGNHIVRMEYYEGLGNAYAYLSYALVASSTNPSTPVATPIPGVPPTPGPNPGTSGGAWTCTYYRNQDLDDPVAMVIVPALSFNWGGESPYPGVPKNLWSMRCTSVQYFPSSGLYQFNAQVDDGVRIYVDGNAVISAWTNHAGTVETGTINVGAGPHTVTTEYYQFGHDSLLTVWWNKK